MKKTVLFCTVLAALAIVSFYAFASSEQSSPKLTEINILGPNSVPEDTQSIFQVVAVYDNGSMIEVTADANVTVTPDEPAVINLGGIVETFKLEQPQKQFTIYAHYRDLKVEKPVTIFSLKQENK